MPEVGRGFCGVLVAHWSGRHELRLFLEAALRQARHNQYPWIVACDATFGASCLREESVVQQGVNVLCRPERGGNLHSVSSK